MKALGAFDELHLDGDFDLEDVDVVARLAELGHGAGDDGGLLEGVGEGLLVAALGVVADELEEEGDVVGEALVADALDPGVLEVVDGGVLEGRVVEQDLDAVGAGFLEAADAPDVEEVGQAAGGVGVVAGLLVGEQEALAVAVLGGGEAVLGVEQDGGGVLGEDVGDEGLESSRSWPSATAPRSLASDFWSDPRWSMAAAAMTPRWSETAFRPASFPGVSFICGEDLLGSVSRYRG